MKMISYLLILTTLLMTTVKGADSIYLTVNIKN